MLFNSNAIVKTENVEVGFVCQYRNEDNANGYRYLRKIMYARSTEDLLISNKQWKVTTKQDLKTGEQGDIQVKMQYGIDLCEKIDGEMIRYLVDSESANKNNGDIVIIQPLKAGPFLSILGFPEYLTSKELRYARKILLDSSCPIKTIPSSRSLREFKKIDLLEVKETIEKLEELKLDGNSSSVTNIERKKFKKDAVMKKRRF